MVKNHIICCFLFVNVNVILTWFLVHFCFFYILKIVTCWSVWKRARCPRRKVHRTKRTMTQAPSQPMSKQKISGCKKNKSIKWYLRHVPAPRLIDRGQPYSLAWQSLFNAYVSFVLFYYLIVLMKRIVLTLNRMLKTNLPIVQGCCADRHPHKGSHNIHDRIGKFSALISQKNEKIIIFFQWGLCFIYEAYRLCFVVPNRYAISWTAV